MIQSIIQVALLATALISSVSAECANACNGHGKCTSYDMCICQRNWQASDCSERVCQFGLAHVDTPKGDLDASGALSSADHPVIDNSFAYPYGTTEQFPQMQDSDLNDLVNSAHYYMECSNKGTCDRTTGECACFDGYDGVACQRASCPGYPNSCSGHGVCKSKKQLAWADAKNTYMLWDKDVSMGCECDSGYTGPDCSERTCKHGVDPLYLDDSATIKYSTYDFATLTTSATADFTNGMPLAQSSPGYWAIRFFDALGEDWVTSPIIAGATCAQVVAALEAIPNNVVPPGLTFCTKTSKAALAEDAWNTWDAQHPNGGLHPYRISYNMSIWESVTPVNQGELSQYTATTDYNSSSTPGTTTHLSGYIYRLKFYGNPGALKEPQIELYLDGKRPSLVSSTANGKVITKVWTDGQQGEDKDYFGDHCDGVTATLGRTGIYYYLTGMTKAEKMLLKVCLGASDFDSSNNVEVYNWDYGSMNYPHLIKLVRSVTTYTDGGYYAAIWMDTTLTALDSSDDLIGTFRLLNPITPPDGASYLNDQFEIYTTTGTFALVSNHSKAVFSFASKNIFMVNSSYDTANGVFDGDISCEVGNNNAYKLEYIHHCLNKTDLFSLLSWEYPHFNPPHINLYTAKRLNTNNFEHLQQDRAWANNFDPVANQYKDMHYMTHQVSTDISTNWGAFDNSLLYNHLGVNFLELIQNKYTTFRVYKFFPAAASTYKVVGECSNRGICSRDTGVCGCFSGYTNDDCSIQNSISL